MKKFFFVVVLCLLCSTVLSACTVAATEHEILSDALNIDVSAGEIKTFTDTHGGFLGDGTYYLILDCSERKEQATELIKDWKPLPLTENLQLIMYGGEKNGVSYA